MSFVLWEGSSVLQQDSEECTKQDSTDLHVLIFLVCTISVDGETLVLNALFFIQYVVLTSLYNKTFVVIWKRWTVACHL
jgi:hypothetical protein